LVRERSQHVLRLQKTLEDANIKIAGIVTNLLGASGRGILQALIDGETAPARLLLATTGRLRKVPPSELLTRLEGMVTPHHRFLLRLHLTQVDALDATLATLDQELEQRLAPFRATVTRLTAIPGVETVLARTLVAEIGAEVTAFATAAHLRAWACVSPRLDESAGRRRSTRQRPGSRWLKPMLIQAAWAAIRCKQSYFRAQYYRLRARRGAKKAIGAVAASLLTTIYHLLHSPTLTFHDLGANYLDQLDPSRAVRRLTARLTALGYTVQITPAASVS
jgi:transposase